MTAGASTGTAGRAASWAAGAVGAIAVVAIVVLAVRAGDPDGTAAARARAAAAAEPAAPVRPRRPPGPNDPKPAPPPLPAMPAMTPALRAQIAEQVRGQARPGEAAFRIVSDRYVDENLEAAKRQAAAEGLTLGEVRELTYFGLMAMATQRFPEIEEITGQPLDEAARDQLAELMQSSNGEFQKGMRALVQRGGGEDERWALIRDAEARYQAGLFRITGLTAEQLDDLLAGNVALPGAPASGEVPEGERAAPPHDDTAPAPRPERP